ncbi:galactose-binding domain-like protein [Hysterangium stoloniferum]|nr:galactose-binding domain-like protein [Hysterangium stoloniferum]
MTTSLITTDVKLKVSSTLDKSVGKKFLTDGSPETCWTSTQGIPQFVQLQFPSPARVTKISITFQGGFVGTRCAVHVLPCTAERGDRTPEWQLLTHIFPEDVNRRQTFDVSSPAGEQPIGQMKLLFEESSDFFGRITIYDLDVEGCKQEDP